MIIINVGAIDKIKLLFCNNNSYIIAHWYTLYNKFEVSYYTIVIIVIK